MNKEQIIDEVYENYVHTHENFKWTDDFCIKNLRDYGDQWDVFSKEEFINKCKTDSEFSEKWGLKIEERELTPKERIELAGGKIQDKYPALVEMSLRVCDERDIPTKLITITFNNEKIEDYE
jgi:hypothetical protein